jgi:hypothetical protein
MSKTTQARSVHSNTRAFKLLVILISLEGLIALPFFFQIPSMQRTSWLFGLSLSRWLVILAFSAIWVLLCVFTARFLIDKTWSRSAHASIHAFLSDPTHFWQSLFISTLLAVSGCVLLIAFNIGSEGLKAGFFGVLFFRLEPLIAWMTLVLMELDLYLILKIRKSTPALDNRYLASMVIVFSLAGVITFIYWLTLYLGLPWLYNLKYWFWLHIDKGGILGWRFVVLLLLSLLVFYLVYKYLRSPKLGLIILMVFGYFLMIGFGFVGGNNGFETIQRTHLYMNSQVEYSSFVSHRWVTPWLVVSQYEEITPDTMLTQQKPPGTLFVYSVFQKLSEALLHPADNHEARLEKLTQLMSVVFPLLAMLALLPLYKIARHFLNERDALIPCILYLTAPNLLLMPIGLDKVLYPALFLIGIYLILLTSQLRTIFSSLLLGLYLYVALFFSFSLVPLLLWAPLWFLVDDFEHNRKALWTRLVRPLAGIGVAFLLSAVIFGLLLNYNIVTRYMITLEWLRYVSQFELSLSYLSEVIFGINLELATWSSFPLILIAGVQVVSSIVAAIRHRLTRMDAFLIVFVIVYIFLNLFCQLNAEVGRTWLFLEAVFALAAGYFISRGSHLRVPAILSLATLQLVTAYFLLAYQCPCW